MERTQKQLTLACSFHRCTQGVRRVQGWGLGGGGGKKQNTPGIFFFQKVVKKWNKHKRGHVPTPFHKKDSTLWIFNPFAFKEGFFNECNTIIVVLNIKKCIVRIVG